MAASPSVSRPVLARRWRRLTHGPRSRSRDPRVAHRHAAHRRAQPMRGRASHVRPRCHAVRRWRSAPWVQGRPAQRALYCHPSSGTLPSRPLVASTPANGHARRHHTRAHRSLSLQNTPPPLSLYRNTHLVRAPRPAYPRRPHPRIPAYPPVLIPPHGPFVVCSSHAHLLSPRAQSRCCTSIACLSATPIVPYPSSSSIHTFTRICTAVDRPTARDRWRSAR